jgi:hypothetical protein
MEHIKLTYSQETSQYCQGYITIYWKLSLMCKINYKEEQKIQEL